MSDPIWKSKQQISYQESGSLKLLTRPNSIIAISIVVIIAMVVLWNCCVVSESSNKQEAPYITADSKPVKIRAENPGGYQPPHSDKLVYELISSDDNSKNQDKLNVIEEKPMVETRFASSVEHKRHVKAKTAGPYKVQLASMRSRADAENQWYLLKKKYPKLLNSLDAEFATVKIKNKNYYRIYVGSFSNKKSAQEICKKYKKNKLACVVAKEA